MRTILAFLIAPLSMFAFLPLLYLSTGWQAFRNLSEAYLAAMGSLVIIYPAMLVIGLPLYLVLRRKSWVSWWSCGAVGYITSVLASFLLSLFFALQNWSGGEPAALAFVNVTRFFTNPGLLFQPTNVLAIGIGLVFWLIADFRRVRA